MDTEDARLVADAVAGDRAAFAALVTRHYDRIFRVAWRILGNRAEAEDLAQDVCATLGRRIRSFRGEAAFTTWLHRLVVNAARDRLRREAARGRAAMGWGDAEGLRRRDAAEREGEVAWLRETLATLSPELRETVALVLGEGLAHGEAAAALGVSPGTVSWRMSEIRRRLRAQAEEERA